MNVPLYATADDQGLLRAAVAVAGVIVAILLLRWGARTGFFRIVAVAATKSVVLVIGIWLAVVIGAAACDKSADLQKVIQEHPNALQAATAVVGLLILIRLVRDSLQAASTGPLVVGPDACDACGGYGKESVAFDRCGGTGGERCRFAKYHFTELVAYCDRGKLRNGWKVLIGTCAQCGERGSIPCEECQGKAAFRRKCTACRGRGRL
jgi:hypothetical protein